ncbi:hypothetical protein CKM354_001210000 [Cercospora kikuchii]|uniref:Uncharacterized protein n=1 Tax=Cercospora kikuchii TaxID=84275 RepID=A0A9P3CZF3_9PEZI|nr:uncharacterized protein CKM354_001210000 [Cercospora kikuchii]GIZ49060.1 hypothetical protein CKM354_001210000 [Cercospora kikuchii]
MEPPAYDEVVHENDIWDGDTKTKHHMSIRDEVGASRSQHVAVLVSKLMPQIRERAKHGLSNSTLLILPSDQAETSRRGELVGFSDDDLPIVIQLDGQYDGSQFWSQDEALSLLKTQMLTELGGSPATHRIRETLPERPREQPKSFWGRKSNKPMAFDPVMVAPAPSVTVEVEMDQVSFRSETEFGLYETMRGRGVLMKVHIQ